VKNPRYVLDSYALLVYLQNEAAAVRIESLLDRASAGDIDLYVSVVNLGELAYIVERRLGASTRERVLETLAAFPIQFAEANLDRVLSAAHVKARYPISYADAFAVALAVELDATVVTGDPEFQRVASLVSVDWLQYPGNQVSG
jgi:ribonuclease VapC